MFRRHDFQRDESFQSLVLGLQHNAHSALTKFVENYIVAKDERLSFAGVDLLGLISGQYLLTNEFTCKLFAVLWLPVRWKR